MRLTQIHRFPKRLLSTVQRGTAFEYRALALLTTHMSMSLTRVGGSYDGGVDLAGWWWVPSNNNLTTHSLDATVAPMGCTIANRRRLRVLAQCKAEKKKMGPAYLRELEGVAYKYAAGTTTTTSKLPHTSEPESPRAPQAIDRADEDPNTTPTTSEEAPTIALLISQSPFTRHCLLTAYKSPLPFLLVHLPPPLPPPSSSSSNSAIGTIFGNPALISAKGVLGGELEIRWEHGGGGGGGGGDDDDDSGVPSSPQPSQSSEMLGDSGRPRLWWQGQPLPSWTPEADTVADVDGDGVVLN